MTSLDQTIIKLISDTFNQKASIINPIFIENINISGSANINNDINLLGNINSYGNINSSGTLNINNIEAIDNVLPLNIMANVINIGGPDSFVNIQGTTTYLAATEFIIRDKMISLNLEISTNSPIDIGNYSGFDIYGISGHGYLRTNEDATKFVLKAPLGEEYNIVYSDLNNIINVTG
jgi:hypothetical protein